MQFLLNKPNLEKRARDIVTLMRDSLTSSTGLLSQGKYKGQLSPELIIDDFGDIAPFIALYGGEDICKVNLDYIEAHKHNLGFDRAFAYTDLILGLLWYSKVGQHAAQSRELAVHLSNQVVEQWYSKDGAKIYSMKLHGVTIPVTNGIDSTFIEVWTEMYREFSDQKYLELAIKTYEYYASIHSSHKTNLIPLHHKADIRALPIQLLRPMLFTEVHIMKDNSNYLFSLLDLIRTGYDKQHVITNFDQVFFTIAGRVTNNTLTNVLSSQGKSDLLSSFALIDIACDAYNTIGKNTYLDVARELADSWLALPANKTGLLPKQYQGARSYFDSETDMAVALIKLYECTGEQKYINKANDLVKGVNEYHWFDEGYALEVDIQTGDRINECIKTKFVALHIKILHILLSEKKIYKDEQLFMLAKDR